MEVYFAITISVFSILVTALITWQIYSYFVVERRIKSLVQAEMTKIAKDINARISLRGDIAEYGMRASTVSLCNIISAMAYSNKDYEIILKTYLVILDDCNEYYKEENVKSTLSTINSFFTLCYDEQISLSNNDLVACKVVLRELAAKDGDAFDVLQTLDRYLLSVSHR